MCALRAKPPEAISKRLKLLMYGPAGVGKTTAAIQFPSSYIIDCEKGTENYAHLIKASQSVVFHTTDFNEVVAEIKSLLTDKHEFRTLVIDPMTTMYNDLVDKCEQKVGQDFGRHIQAANKQFKRLINLMYQLDMNVCVTAHSKAEYGQNMAKLGITYDGFKAMDYMLDLVIELGKKGKKRFGKVVKTRIESFPDEESFEWSYQAIKDRYDNETLEKEATAVTLANPEQVAQLKGLIDTVRLPDGIVDKWLSRAGVETFDDMPAETIAKCIAFVQNRIGGAAA
jgi:hypothetical protein